MVSTCTVQAYLGGAFIIHCLQHNKFTHSMTSHGWRINQLCWFWRKVESHYHNHNFNNSNEPTQRITYIVATHISWFVSQRTITEYKIKSCNSTLHMMLCDFLDTKKLWLDNKQFVARWAAYKPTHVYAWRHFNYQQGRNKDILQYV